MSGEFCVCPTCGTSSSRDGDCELCGAAVDAPEELRSQLSAALARASAAESRAEQAERERDDAREKLQKARLALESECETCEGTGVMFTSDDGEGLNETAEVCGECNGTGRGHIAAWKDSLRKHLALTRRRALLLGAGLRKLRGVRERLMENLRDAHEAMACVARVNWYLPCETFPHAITTSNRYRATVDAAGALKKCRDKWRNACLAACKRLQREKQYSADEHNACAEYSVICDELRTRAETERDRLRAEVEQRRLRAARAIELLRESFRLRPNCKMVDEAAEDACAELDALRERRCGTCGWWLRHDATIGECTIASGGLDCAPTYQCGDWAPKGGEDNG